MPLTQDNSCQTAPTGATGARQGPNVLRLPNWVLSKIATRPEAYTGQLTVNFFQGGVTNIEWREIMKETKRP
jgi:hypothetical protein